MSSIQALHALGQSIWLDYIRRDLLDSGDLARMMADGTVRGVTSNPSIFEAAIGSTDLYDGAVRPLAQAGWSAEEILEQVAVEDIRRATDTLLPLYEGTDGADGYVSLEVNPKLAFETEATLEEARRLWARVNRPNLMIKIPATEPGLPAIEQAIYEGINVNVTLIFSLERYGQVVEAYLAGLERRLAGGDALTHVASVASFFVSRVDSLVDSRLEAIMREEGARAPRAAALRGKAAIANAKLAYAQYCVNFESERFEALRAQGARAQRPLWASTSTKNPDYSDVLYVESLIGPHTVNTVPPETLEAFADHGHAERTIDRSLSASRAELEAIEALGISMAEVTTQLEREGVEKFATSFESLLKTLIQRAEDFRDEIQSIQGHYAQMLRRLNQDEVGKRLWRREAELWIHLARDADATAGVFDWLDAPRNVASELAELRGLSDAMKREGREVVGLIGLGPTHLLSQVLEDLGKGKPLARRVALNSLDPDSVRRFLRGAPTAHSLSVVGDLSLIESEQESILNLLWTRAERAQSSSAGASLAVICRADSRLASLAEARGIRRVMHLESDPGDLFSALAVPQLIPAQLQGGSMTDLLNGAARMARDCGPRVEAAANPGLALGAMLVAASASGRNLLRLLADPELEAFAGWLNETLAPWIGLEVDGILPTTAGLMSLKQGEATDELVMYLRHSGKLDAELPRWMDSGLPVLVAQISDHTDLGGEIFRWQVATLAARHLLGHSLTSHDPLPKLNKTLDGLLGSAGSDADLPLPRKSQALGDLEIWGDDRLDEAAPKSSPGSAFLALLRQFDEYRVFWLLPYYDLPSAERRVWSQIGAEMRSRIGAELILDRDRSTVRHLLMRSAKHGPSGMLIQLVPQRAKEIPLPESGGGVGRINLARALADYEELRRSGQTVMGIRLGKPGDTLRFAREVLAATQDIGREQAESIATDP